MHPVRAVSAGVCLAALLGAAPSPVSGQVPANGYDSLFDQMMNLPALIRPGGDIKGVTVEREKAVTFNLEAGRLFALGPVSGRTVGAVFVGQGRVHFTPPTAFERAQLKRVAHSDSLDRSFGSLVLLFADSSGTGLDRATTTAQGPAVSDPAAAVRRALGYLGNKGKQFMDPHLMSALLNRERNELFYAVIGDIEGGPFVLRIDPYEVEELSLSVAKSGPSLTDDRSVLVSSDHWPRDYTAGARVPNERKDRFSINRYVIDATLAKDLKFHAAATLNIDWLGPTQDWFYFWLFADLKVDSARWQGGKAATFHRGKDSPVLWVQRPPSTGPGVPPLTFYYHGDLIENNGYWTELKTSSEWYPAVDVGYGAPVTAIFDLTFHTPRGYAFASVGQRTALDSAGDVLTSHWVTKDVAAHASFNIGKFDVFDVKDTRNLPVTVFINQEAHNRLGALAYRDQSGRIHGGIMQKDMKESVGEDVALSLNFFRDAFGDPGADRFYATEIFALHGQAFPGLIHFSFMTFQGFLLDKGEDEAFRAHEMAHQWWGLALTPQSYRDAWLSEGFAEFSSWWYTQAILRDSVALHKIVKKARDALMLRRHQAGPIWLGTRLGEGDLPQDYQLVVYEKGAWVLRMLYYLMLDPDTGERAFRAMMKDYYETYRGLAVSTRDFQDLVSKHFREPMDWFFDSWVYGTGIPSYEWSQTTEQNAGKFTWKLHVNQKDVRDDFAMRIPVHFYFADGRDGTAQVLVKGPSTDWSVELPARPSRVTFNDSEAVLADVKEVKWR
jgi:hypothetical protein